MTTFGSGGMGVFPMAELLDEKLTNRYELHLVGPCEGVEEHFYALGTEKKVLHPLVQRLLPPRS
jgi:LysR family transcriptional activator of nhaA